VQRISRSGQQFSEPDDLHRVPRVRDAGDETRGAGNDVLRRRTPAARELFRMRADVTETNSPIEELSHARRVLDVKNVQLRHTVDYCPHHVVSANHKPLIVADHALCHERRERGLDTAARA
jgi:hypothetical protein